MTEIAPVAVYGATGYTGRQIAAELVAASIPVVIAGRSGAALDALAERLDGDVERVVVGIDDEAGLRALCEGVPTIVHAAGPFFETCEPVVRAAVATGTHYVDIDGEQPIVRRLRDRHGRAAEERGVALLPASAFYATLPDLAVALAAEGLGHVHDLDIAYDIRDWRPSGAGFANRLEGIGKPIVEWEAGAEKEVGDLSLREFAFPPVRRVIAYPAPEVLTVPRHLSVDRVRTAITARSLTPAATVRTLPLVIRAAAALLRTPAAPLVTRGLALAMGGQTARVPLDPTTFAIVARLRGEHGTRTATVEGRGIFDVTAPIAARTARATLDPGFAGRGFLAPAEILDPARFLGDLADHGVRVTIDPPPER